MRTSSSVPAAAAWRIVRTGLPLSASQLVTLAIGFINVAMLSALGAPALAGGGLAISVFSVVAIAGSSAMAGVTPVAGATLASDRSSTFDDTIRAAIHLAAGLGVALGAVLLFASALAGSFAPSLEASLAARSVLGISSLAVPALAIGAVTRQALTCLDLSRDVLFTQMAVIPTSIGLNFLLGFGAWGFRGLGAAGIAISMVAACWLGAITQLALLRRRRRRTRAAVESCVSHREVQTRLLRLGWPVAAAVLLEAGAFHLGALVVASFGVAWLGAHVLAAQVASVAFAVPLGLAHAAAAALADAEEGNASDRAARGAISVGIGAGLLVAGILLLGRERLARLLAPDGDVLTSQRLASLLSIVALFHLGDSAQCVAAGILRGRGRTRPTLAAALATYGFIAPVVAAISIPRWGPAGLWYGLSVAMSCAAIALSVMALQRASPLRS